jgi:hypothetical protein
MRTTSSGIPLLALLLPAALLVLAEEPETEVPALSIVSELGVDQDVKLFNEEPVTFFARLRGRENAPLLRGVDFVLYDEGGRPGREEHVQVRSEDPPRWGKPPSSFSHPLEGRSLPIGSYRLRAEKRGWQFAEIKVVKAQFGYGRLSAEHERDLYRAEFHIRLVDSTEKRLLVPVSALVETANGGLLDRQDGNLVRNLSRTWLWESTAPVRISSRAQTPDRERPAGERTGVLKLVPNCRLVLVLDGVRFSYPVPLPPETKSGNVGNPGDPDLADPEGGRNGRGR